MCYSDVRVARFLNIFSINESVRPGIKTVLFKPHAIISHHTIKDIAITLYQTILGFDLNHLHVTRYDSNYAISLLDWLVGCVLCPIASKVISIYIHVTNDVV